MTTMPRTLRLALLAAAAALPLSVVPLGHSLGAQPLDPPPRLIPYPGVRSSDQISRPSELGADLIGVVALGRVIWSSGYDQVAQSPKVWPRDAESYGRRFVTRSAQLVAIETVRHGLAAALDRDPAYVPCRCTAFGPRLGHVAKAVVTDFDTSGRRRIGWPRFAGAVAGAAVLGQLQPGQGSAGTVAFRAVTTVGSSVLGNAVKEFALWERLVGSGDK